MKNKQDIRKEEIKNVNINTSLKSSEHLVKTMDFEGPLDLLCYLVQKNKLEIDKISISEITDEYLEYIYARKKLNLEVATEFIVMASTLIYIKSKKMLPRKEEEAEEEISEEELKRKILEYKKYKEISKQMEERYNLFNYRKNKVPEEIKYSKKEFSGIYIPYTLTRAYKEQILKYNEKENANKENIEKLIIKEKVTVKSKLKEILNVFKKVNRFVFNKLFAKEERSKAEIVAAFLGILEMSNRDKVTIHQERNFDQIEVRKKED